MKNIVPILMIFFLISCTRHSPLPGDEWLNETIQRLDHDSRIVMSKDVQWMSDPTGAKTPFLEGHLKTTIEGKTIDREFNLSFRKQDGKWILQNAGFVGSDSGDERLNRILADIYGKDEFIRAGMLMSSPPPQAE